MTIASELALDSQALKSFSEAELWGLVHRRLAWTERERYSELATRGKAGTMSRRTSIRTRRRGL